MMLNAVLMGAMFVVLVHGQKHLKSALSDPQEVITYEMRKIAAREYANQRLVERNSQHNAIRAAGKYSASLFIRIHTICHRVLTASSKAQVQFLYPANIYGL